VRIIIGIIAALVVAAIAAVFLVPSLSWRAQVLAMRATGQLADIEWGELLEMLSPGSPFWVEPLTENPNPYAVIRNPHTSPDDLRAGGELFRQNCAACHGADARGGKGPNLIDHRLVRGDSDWALYRTIRDGIPGTSMPALQLAATDRWRVVAHLLLSRNQSATATRTDREAAPGVDVTAADIEGGAAGRGEWLTYSGNYLGWRHSPLRIMTVERADRIRLAWTRQFQVGDQHFEATPILVGGVMYLTTPPSDVWAIDATTGRTLWHHEVSVPDEVPACCGRVNRGLAVWGGRVFVGALHGMLKAIDAATGELVWETQVADYRDGYTITVAPLALRGKVVVGVSGGEYGIRGFLDAYAADTGKRLWRFDTIPGPGQFGNETWAGDSWKTGGGPTWVTGSFDPALGLLYWGVGNPSPDSLGSVREGDNLFTNAVVALDVETGKRVWHFQFTPHDVHDRGPQTPILVDATIDGVTRKLLLTANRNGFYYVLDRTNGAVLQVTPFARQNWALRMAPDGRVTADPLAAPSEKGTLVWPGMGGAANWWPSSYSPKDQLYFVPYLDTPSVYYGRGPEALPARKGMNQWIGSAWSGGAETLVTGVKALRPESGSLVWQHEMPARRDYGAIGGILTTDGGLLFVGDHTVFYALSSANGRLLWQVDLGRLINAAPVSYGVDGRQYVTIAAGDSLFSFVADPAVD